MVDATIRDRLLDALGRLPLEFQRRVLSFAESLSVPEGASGEDVLALAGLFDTAEAQSMMDAIEAECERVDRDAW